MTIAEVGEKRLIAEILRPLLNPDGNPDSVGDDCAIIGVSDQQAICVSTDRVPADLVAYQTGLIDLQQLGYYLAVLNISDLAAAGATPKGLLLNLGLPSDFSLSNFRALVGGVAEAATQYLCPIVGGDLSDAVEMNLVATSIGLLTGSERLYRSGAEPGDVVFCCNTVGITPSAFTHYLERNKRMVVSPLEEDVLCRHFRQPKAQIALGSLLRQSGACSAVMDNTDGLGQSLLELTEASGVAIDLDGASLPIDQISHNVAQAYGTDLFDMVLGPGADFQLIGTARTGSPGFERVRSQIHVIGTVRAGNGVWIKRPGAEAERLVVQGWNYYKRLQN
jgi:thiamine-monophosphate kinase